ncbi:glycosyltransferase [Duganella sp. CY15W]|uniref:glycosyltransferase family 2 protein n=1 Tax=Duganella sp. CY15W TaxID=2692172 RepID=UPI00136B3A1A|nr:glycosyltransferase [Duganella sp. CY15W]MYM29579.1 glycosyltransferase [Duganella sp. CY15W]
MSYPKVSIIIPSYKPQHFEMCLRSAIGQTYLNTEILVSDNCPTEEIRDICARYAHNGVIYQRSSVYREQNVNAALAGAKGEYVKPLFDDDLLHPFCLERMVAAMQPRPEVELVFSASQVINSDNERTETRRPYEASGTLSGLDVQRRVTLGMENFIGEFTTVMFRRQTMWNVGLHNLYKMGDHDFLTGLADLIAYLNLTKNASMFYIDEELTYFRKDQRLQSNSNPASNPFFGNCFSDYIDLLRVSLDADTISRDEYRSMNPQVDAVFLRLNNIFPQVGEARERYLAKLAKLDQ